MQTIEYCTEADIPEQLEKMLAEDGIIDEIDISEAETGTCRIVLSSHADSSEKRIKVVTRDE